MQAQLIKFQQRTHIKQDTLNNKNELTETIKKTPHDKKTIELILATINYHKESFDSFIINRHLLNTLTCTIHPENYNAKIAFEPSVDGSSSVYTEYSFDLVVQSLNYKCLAIYPDDIYIIVDPTRYKVIAFKAIDCDAFIVDVD
jgi:hypothetical protein